MVVGFVKGVVFYGSEIKLGMIGDSNLGDRSGRRSTQRSVAEWSAEPGAEVAQIRRVGEGGGHWVYATLRVVVWEASFEPVGTV